MDRPITGKLADPTSKPLRDARMPGRRQARAQFVPNRHYLRAHRQGAHGDAQPDVLPHCSMTKEGAGSTAISQAGVSRTGRLPSRSRSRPRAGGASQHQQSVVSQRRAPCQHEEAQLFALLLLKLTAVGQPVLGHQHLTSLYLLTAVAGRPPTAQPIPPKLRRLLTIVRHPLLEANISRVRGNNPTNQPNPQPPHSPLLGTHSLNMNISLVPWWNHIFIGGRLVEEPAARTAAEREMTVKRAGGWAGGRRLAVVAEGVASLRVVDGGKACGTRGSNPPGAAPHSRRGGAAHIQAQHLTTRSGRGRSAAELACNINSWVSWRAHRRRRPGCRTWGRRPQRRHWRSRSSSWRTSPCRAWLFRGGEWGGGMEWGWG